MSDNQTTLVAGWKLRRPVVPLPAATRSLFHFTNPARFDQMSDEDLAQHIANVRDETETVSPWPCLSWFSFMPPLIRTAPPPNTYSRIVEHLRAHPEDKILDLGCMFGHDARALLQDGVKPTQVVAADLIPALFDLGHKLFDDRTSDAHLNGTTWRKVDIFNEQDTASIEVPGGYYAIFTARFVHLFPLEQQKVVVKTLNRLLARRVGATIFGVESGREEGKQGLYDTRAGMSMGPTGISDKADVMYHHSARTYKDLYESVEPGAWSYEIVLKMSPIPCGDGEPVVDPQFADALQGHLSYVITRQ